MKEVFISYSTKDITPAETVRNILEQNGLSCWMAPRDIPGGSNYTKEIPVAIRNCKVFVLILSTNSQNSHWVLKEVDAAVNAGKIILPFMLENFDLNDEFNFLLTGAQRYLAYQQKAETVQALVNRVRAIVQMNTPPVATQETPVETPVAAPAEPVQPAAPAEAPVPPAVDPAPQTEQQPKPEATPHVESQPEPVVAAPSDGPHYCPTCGRANIRHTPDLFKFQGVGEHLARIGRMIGWGFLGFFVFALLAGMMKIPDIVYFFMLVGGIVLGCWWGKRRAKKKVALKRLRHGKQVTCYRCDNCKILFNYTVQTKQH